MANTNLPFNYKFNTLWRKIILNNLESSSNKHYYGYYVWCDKRTLKYSQLKKYIARYIRHPAIANGRIMKYNKNNITFYYKDNQNKQTIIKKPIKDFINSLIQHIPPSQFKIIRYYGAYNK